MTGFLLTWLALHHVLYYQFCLLFLHLFLIKMKVLTINIIIMQDFNILCILIYSYFKIGDNIAALSRQNDILNLYSNICHYYTLSHKKWWGIMLYPPKILKF